MANHLSTLFELNARTLDLDMVQDWINEARVAAPTNQRVQQALNHQQTIIDLRRAEIAMLRLEISSRN